MRVRVLTAAVAFQCVCICLLFSGCGGDKIAQSEWERLAAIRAESEDAWSDLITVAYKSDSAGTTGFYDVALEKHRRLFTRDNIELLKRIEHHFGTSPDSSAINLLKVYLIAGYCSVNLARTESSPLPLIIALYSPSLCVSPAWSKLERELATIDGHEQRRELYLNELAGLQESAEQIKHYQAEEDSLLRRLGYKSSLDFYLEFHRVDSESIRRLATSVLTSSDSVYYALLAQVTGYRTGSQSDSLRIYDLPYFISEARRGLMFPADSVIAGLQATLSDMGIPLDLQEVFDVAVTGDDDHCKYGGVYPLRLPDKVRVLLGSEDDLISLLSGHIAVGRALPYYFTEARDFTSRYLGDNSGNFANGFLFGGLLAIPDYLVKHFGMSRSDAARMSDVVRLLMLLQVRRDCAVAGYETALLSGEGDPEKVFSEEMRNALGVAVDVQDQTLRYDLSTVLNSADRLRGALLAFRMMSKLKKDFGSDLYIQPAAGKELATLWSHGHDLSVEHELQLLGLSPLFAPNRGQ